MSTPDFDALRAQRNANVWKGMQKRADEWGCEVDEIRSTFNPDACYCACATGGPCEHKWDGEPYESEDDYCWSTTCSRCGCTSMSHDMRNAP